MKTKRTWCFLQPPIHFEIRCPKCNSVNTQWSEFEKHIWCGRCGEDIDDYESPMDGPLPVQVAALLGIDLRVIDLKDDKVKTIEEVI